MHYFNKKGLNTIMSLVVLLVCIQIYGQDLERPFILVKSSERNQILEKIKTQQWANDIYTDLLNKIEADVEKYLKNPEDYIMQLPFNWSESQENSFPPFYKTYHVENGVYENLDNATDKEWIHGKNLIKHLQIALDCGTAYFISKEDKYADLATSILYSFVKSVQKSKLSDWHGRGGWLFPDDGFREVRELGEKVPLIYDYIAKYIKEGGQPFDIIKNKRVEFPIEEAQNVFRTYADITINYGHTGHNHPVLEAPSLVYNALALEDAIERKKLLSYFLTENTKNQDALNIMAASYKNEGDIWPETSQYFNGVATRLARLMLIVNRYDPSLRLGEKYQNVLYGLPKLDYLVYPNGDIVRWGDGHRYGKPSFSSYENAYLLGEIDGVKKLTNKFGPLLNKALKEGKYKRKGIESVFWYGNSIRGNPTEFKLPRTDRVFHAGIVLQRNESITKNPKDGLMCFVGGAHMVHGHAEGMNMELYGEGQVLGVDNGRGRYQKDIHENYSRIFAAHNTVIVNGSSQGEGGWVNLGINTVELISMEPDVGKAGVSPYHSFSQTSFEDDRGEKAEATQERTLALIRTSPTTGYYVDVFRSNSRLPNEYHDYLYHNIGDEIVIENKDMNFEKTPNRYMANANATWKRNKQYRNPGWHFFKNVKTSKIYDKDVKLTFNTKKLKRGSVFMQLHIPGFENRVYTKVKAPITFEAPKPYDNLPTPTLVIRNKGEAWDNPFVVVYEPFNDNEKPTIKSVTKLEQDGIYRGLKIVSKTPSETLIQYVITQSKNQIFEDKKLKIYFKGTLAVVTLNSKEKLQSIYIGEGEKLVFRSKEFIPKSPLKNLYVD